MSARRAHVVVVLLVCALILLAAGCGGGGADRDRAKGDAPKTTSDASSGAGAAHEPSRAGAAVPATLHVELSGIAAKNGSSGLAQPARATCTKATPATCRATLTCPPTATSRAGDDRLCAWVATTPTSVLSPPSPDDHALCTQQYGGPERATVTGERDGQAISVSFRRTDGCEIARWDAAAPLWTGNVPPTIETPQSTDSAPRAVDGDMPDVSQPEIITDPIR
ncbi:MAG: serine protease inhibitor [Thermoleophilia bacterium]|nr:serine protease inhibitor [Thermoleophilia bacterium]